MAQKNPGKRVAVIALALLALAVLVALLLVRCPPGTRPEAPPPELSAPSRSPDSMETDTAAPRQQPVPTQRPPVKKPGKSPPETTLTDTTAMRKKDTAAAFDPCSADTVGPWVYPDPSGGLHRGAVAVVLQSSKPCRIEWRRSTDSQWREYRPSESIPVTGSQTLLFKAVDSCGNEMAAREENYEIAARDTVRHCPAGMELIAIAGTKFCIDKYEWPNMKGTRPKAFISVYNAMDSCFSIGKRLCSADEWILACSGPYAWRYTYGSLYEPYACVTADTTAHPSGNKSECRGYFDVYDMSGNLAEWTSTRSAKNRQFYNVMGGFWESGVQSTCQDSRYSYFPQNRHNPVGFRCCADTLENR
jgi:hypothetical protein